MALAAASCPAGKPRPLDSRYFTPTEEIARAFKGAPRIDFKRFRRHRRLRRP